jgi:hypothetical protein
LKQFWNALTLILVTVFGISTDVKLVPENTESPINVTFEIGSNVNDVKPEPANAPVSMLVTELGIVIDDKPVQLRNARYPIVVTIFPIVAPIKFEELGIVVPGIESVIAV